MAVCNPWDKASQQHMALRRQEDSVHPTVLVHQHQTVLVEVGSEAHLLLPTLDHQDQQLERQPNLLTQIQTLCLTEGK